MFKRRLAVLGAAAVLAITGLAGSALADEAPVPAGTEVICTTSDGKVVALAKALPADAESRVATRDGKVKLIKPGEKVDIESVPDGDLPEAVTGKALPVPEGEFTEAVPALPVLPAEPGVAGPSIAVTVPAEGAQAKTVSIMCEKPE
ncbi:hypothetical protein [Nonomuraea sp. NPDC050643]|uniref:hypothetical protein n=1 Tax=Nonomuraea sp. NPDC050643 TaxID=3155660 RepID=UPI0033C8C28A